MNSKNVWKPLAIAVTSFLLIVTALGAWAISSPVGSSPDDEYHLTSIWCAGDGYPGMCEASGNPDSRLVAAAVTRNPFCFAAYGDNTPKCQLDSGILNDLTPIETEHGNFKSGNYPPVYYSVMHLFASKDVTSSVLMMRLFNIVLFSLLLVALWFASSPATKNAQKILWFVTLVPLGMFLITSNNPSSWTVIGLGIAAMSLYEFLNASHSKIRNLILAGIFILSSIMAAGARTDGAAYLAIVIVCVVIASYQKIKFGKAIWVIPALGLLIAAGFFLTSRQSSIAATGFNEGAVNDVVSPIALLVYNLNSFPTLLIGSFTGMSWGLGWFDTPMPESVWVTACALYFSVLVVSWQKLDKYSGVALSLLSASVVAVPLYVMQVSGFRVGQYIQPRYIYPMIVALGALALLVGPKFTQFGSRYWRIFVVVSASAANFIALYVNLHRYTVGALHPYSFNLNANLEWWWPAAGVSPMTVLIAGGLSFLLLAVFLVKPWKR